MPAAEEADDWITGASPSSEASDIDLKAIAEKYPALAKHLTNTVAQWGEGPGVMEFYHPDDPENPNKGKITLQFRDRTVPKDQLPDFAAADLLHYLGGDKDGNAVDPKWAEIRSAMLASRTASQIKADQENFQQEKSQFGENGSFDDYMKNNRADAYMRGAVFPGINPEWKGFLTPEQVAIGQQAKQYLTAAPAKGLINTAGQ